MEITKLIGFFKTLPNETTREYELTLTKLARHTLFPEQRTETKDSLKSLLTDLLDSDYTDDIRYPAFFCLNIVHRNNKDFDLLNALFRKYGAQFSSHIMYNHLKAIFEIESGAIYDYDTMLNATYLDATLFNNHSGCLHLFADAVATIWETGDLNDKDAYRRAWFDRAIDAVDKAIALEPNYAKYYCTKARILCINGNYAMAEKNLNNAISYEDSSRNDYFLRISTYQYYRALIVFQKMLSEYKTSAFTAETKSIPTPYTGDESYAFISYSHKDSDRVYEIINNMQAKNLRVWFDKGIPPTSQDFVETIAQKIRNCDTFILMISNNSLNAEWVRKEHFYAVNNNINIIYIFMEDSNLPAGAELQMGSHQRIKKFELADDEFHSQLYSSLKQIEAVEKND